MYDFNFSKQNPSPFFKTIFTSYFVRHGSSLLKKGETNQKKQLSSFDSKKCMILIFRNRTPACISKQFLQAINSLLKKGANDKSGLIRWHFTCAFDFRKNFLSPHF